MARLAISQMTLAHWNKRPSGRNPQTTGSHYLPAAAESAIKRAKEHRELILESQKRKEGRKEKGHRVAVRLRCSATTWWGSEELWWMGNSVLPPIRPLGWPKNKPAGTTCLRSWAFRKGLKAFHFRNCASLLDRFIGGKFLPKSQPLLLAPT